MVPVPTTYAFPKCACPFTAPFTALTDRRGADISIVSGDSIGEIVYTFVDDGRPLSATLSGVTGGISINSSGDANRIRISDLDVQQSLNVVSGAGSDLIELFDVRIGEHMRVVSGAGDDMLIGIRVTVAGNACCFTQQGNDMLALAELHSSSNITVSTGAGVDSIELHANTIDGQNRFDLGTGADALLVSDKVFTKRAPEIIGNTGADTFVDTQNNKYATPTPDIHQFEQIEAVPAPQIAKEHYAPGQNDVAE